MGGLDGGVHLGFRILDLPGQIASDLIGLLVDGRDIGFQLGCSGLEIGSDLVGLGVDRLRLLARVIDARLRVPADLLALGDRLVGLRHGLVGGLLRILRGLVDAARVHERQLITILVDAIRAILRAIANDDVRAARAGNAHGAHLVGLLGQGEAHGLHAQAQAERRIVWI